MSGLDRPLVETRGRGVVGGLQEGGTPSPLIQGQHPSSQPTHKGAGPPLPGSSLRKASFQPQWPRPRKCNPATWPPSVP